MSEIEKKLSVENGLNKEDVIQDQIDDLIVQLLKRRKKMKLTQCQLAEITGVPQATIARMETFANEPALGTVIKLANAMNMALTFNEAAPEKQVCIKE